MEHHGGLVPVPLGVGLELIEEGLHVGRRRLLAAVAAREGQIGLKHAPHLVDVADAAVNDGADAADRATRT